MEVAKQLLRLCSLRLVPKNWLLIINEKNGELEKRVTQVILFAYLKRVMELNPDKPNLNVDPWSVCQIPDADLGQVC